MAENNSLWYEFKKGLWQDIPPFRLVLGTCPTLASLTGLKRHIDGARDLFVLFAQTS